MTAQTPPVARDLRVRSGRRDRRFQANDPDWFDTTAVRLPAFADQFGEDGTLLPERAAEPPRRQGDANADGDVKGQFEFDMFGVGAGRRTDHDPSAPCVGTVGKIGGGQTNSQFMDVDVFPNTLEYWGPNGMLFFRNVAGVLGTDREGRRHEPATSPSRRRARAATPACTPTASNCRT